MKGAIFKKLGISIANLTMKKLPKLDEFSQLNLNFRANKMKLKEERMKTI